MFLFHKMSSFWGGYYSVIDFRDLFVSTRNVDFNRFKFTMLVVTKFLKFYGAKTFNNIDCKILPIIALSLKSMQIKRGFDRGQGTTKKRPVNHENQAPRFRYSYQLFPFRVSHTSQADPSLQLDHLRLEVRPSITVVQSCRLVLDN